MSYKIGVQNFNITCIVTLNILFYVNCSLYGVLLAMLCNKHIYDDKKTLNYYIVI